MTVFFENRVLLLTTPGTSYSAYLGDDDIPIHTHWGDRITPADAAYLATSTAARLAGEWPSFRSPANSHEEYPLDGRLQFGRAALSLGFGDVRSTEWSFAGHVVHDGRELELLFDAREVRIGLHYRVYDDCDVIDRWVTLRNESGDAVDVHRLDSATWVMPEQAQYRMSHLTGRWAAETRLGRTDLAEGRFVLESRRGSRATTSTRGSRSTTDQRPRSTARFTARLCTGAGRGDCWPSANSMSRCRCCSAGATRTSGRAGWSQESSCRHR